MDSVGAPNDVSLLQGCYLEAQRSDDIWLKLEGLRIAINEPSSSHLAVTITSIRTGARRLRHLADVAQVHRDRVQFVLNPLNTVLPCLSRSLRDIKSHYDDRSRSRQNRWRHMYHSLTNEAGGLPLPSRFAIYNKYVSLLRDILLRSPNFDLAAMESLAQEILRLREARGFVPPSPAQAGPLLLRHTGFIYEIDPISHWAEHIFSTPLSLKTPFRNVGQTKSLGPHKELGEHYIPMNSKVLIRQSFEQDQLSLTVFNNSQNNCAYLLLRTIRDDKAWFALRGAHELCMERDGSSLQLRRWSGTEHRSKLWAILFFRSWEELVLMYCTFVSLKAHNNLTLQFASEELGLRGEKKLFQACIWDDGFNHSLIVYEERATHSLRLHAAVWDGELRQCPVWTVFGTVASTSPFNDYALRGEVN
ncbi:hypothetical protein C2857_005310 [Epichloe festucae Fl1]|uniref:Uncharacterized protein n=1 Tax=Epichloe festucae (strain Fl1) TaxID=877507 RepID=A0A7S9KSN6_EPIFF|nr:hypothetical protein C2857_005310 [Epichloe festucae Fl1]